MSSDTAAVPEPVVVPPPAAPAAPVEAPAVDPVVKIAEEIAGMYNVVDWKKPVPTALAVFAHVSTMTSLTGEQRLKAVQHVITTIAKRGGTSEDEGAAAFFATQVLPHILHAIESLTAGKIPSVEAVKDFAQTEMKAVAPVVIAELKKVSGWCGW
jgi:hypothetical protein